ncbi:MAG: hypothetical protein L6Q97_14860 [Thermoanaerobaculia bacterium]|nr:hypothetical protein [Thermoanaerobaculia bacterium]
MKEKTPEELVRDYLYGRLSPDDRDTFQNRLQSEPELTHELALQRAEMAASELLIATDTRDLFEQWRKEKQSKGGYPGIRPLLWLGSVAAGVLFIFAAIRFFSPGPVAKTEQSTVMPVPSETQAIQNPAAQNEAGNTDGALPEKPVAHTPKNYRQLAVQLLPAPMLPTLRRIPDDSSVSIFYRAELAYSKGNYQETLDLLDQTDSTRWQATAFLSAHALFKLNRFAEAETRFDRLAALNSRQFRYPAEWGVLMCRLADFSNREQDVRHQLAGILARPDHPYFEQAQTLEKKLKE